MMNDDVDGLLLFVYTKYLLFVKIHIWWQILIEYAYPYSVHIIIAYVGGNNDRRNAHTYGNIISDM